MYPLLNKGNCFFLPLTKIDSIQAYYTVIYRYEIKEAHLACTVLVLGTCTIR